MVSKPLTVLPIWDVVVQSVSHSLSKGGGGKGIFLRWNLCQSDFETRNNFKIFFKHFNRSVWFLALGTLNWTREWFKGDDLGMWDISLAVNAPFCLIWLLIWIILRSYLYREAFDLNCALQENSFYSIMNPIFPFALPRSATDSFLFPTAQGGKTKCVFLAPAGWLVSLVPLKQHLRGSLFIFLNYLYILHA